jgi:hypothetical protein
MAKAQEPKAAPKEEPAAGNGPADVDAQQVLEGSIDERMAALREDHIAMGARAKGDHYKPRG